MCLACEMDALWLAEMVEEAARTRAVADGKPPADKADAVATSEPTAKPEPSTTNPFFCEETRSE